MLKGYGGKNFIDGQWLDNSSEGFANIDPCTEEEMACFPQSSPASVSLACESARLAFDGWKKLSRVNRAEYLFRVANILERDLEKFATAISMETGKNYNESVAEVNEALHMAQYAFGTGRMPHGEALASEIPEKDAYMLRKPKGVVAIISPWNFPLAIGAFWCAAPALVEGNTIVIKPSEDAPLSTELAVKAYEEAGIPPGVFNLIHGDGEVGDLLARNESIDHICFTGSAEVGQHIRRVCADSWHKTCSCEMGSKSAVIVFDDANFDLAVSASIASSFKLSGQRCVSAGRLIVQRGIYDKFAESFASYALQVSPGKPFNEEATQLKESSSFFAFGDGKSSWVTPVTNELSYMGPLINEQQFNRVLKFNEMVREDSEATVLVDSSHARPGYFVTPMVYKTEWRNVPYLKNEVFGPHVAIIPFDTMADAIRIYNDTDYGLAVGVITEDFKKARACRDNCDYGMCYWNGGSIAAESHMAFGGVKKSGNGFPSAARTVRAVTHEVSWTVNHDDELSFPQGMK
jgi:aldehyde dehydrogenase (NAD+)